MKEQTRKICAWAVAATLPLALASQAAIAHADCTVTAAPGHLNPTCVDDVGLPICFHTPRAVPGLSGLPRWTDLPGSQAVRDEVGDPRWSNAPLRPQAFDRLTSSNDNVRYRVLVNDAANPTQLMVSIQARADTGTPTSSDFVYFGLANSAGTLARGIKIGLTSDESTTPGQHLSVRNNGVYSYTYNNTTSTWSADAVQAWPTDVVPWVADLTTALWNDPAQVGINGASWAVQFVVNLAPLGLAGGGQAAKLMVGASNDFGVNPTDPSEVIGRIQYFTPNLARCVGPNGAASCTRGGGIGNPFLAFPLEWAPVSAIGSACAGLNIDGSNISTLATLGTTSNMVNVSGGDTNTFRVQPQKPAGFPVLAPNDVLARFRMSNWGTVATPAEWLEIPGGGSIGNTTTDLSSPMSHTCSNPGPASTLSVCGLGITTNLSDTSFHQCLQVELRAGPSARDKVTFENATAYTNTRFKTLSSIDETAEINVKGLQALLGNSNNRDVYLHVVRRNMPEAGDTEMRLDVPALESLRAQVDSGFASGRGYCENPTDACFAGVCAYRCPDPTSELPCGRFDQPIRGKDYCYCPGEGEFPETCDGEFTPPAGGGFNLDRSSLNGPQVLTAAYPTFEVFPYYDSGKTVLVDGASRRSLIPMPTFALHMVHEGPFYGFLSGLVTETGAPITKVAPDIYKITVPNESTARIRVLVSAEEQPHALPFTDMTGTATTFGRLDKLALAGVAKVSTALNLSRTTVTLNDVLDDSGRELVGGMSANVTLTRKAGATANRASFTKSGTPTVNMEIFNLPLVGYVTALAITKASISRPAACGWFGSAMLGTGFTMSDGISPPARVRGVDQWSCVPFNLTNALPQQ